LTRVEGEAELRRVQPLEQLREGVGSQGQIDEPRPGDRRGREGGEQVAHVALDGLDERRRHLARGLADQLGQTHRGVALKIPQGGVLVGGDQWVGPGVLGKCSGDGRPEPLGDELDGVEWQLGRHRGRW